MGGEYAEVHEEEVVDVEEVVVEEGDGFTKVFNESGDDRLNFIKKVYAIVFTQLAFTVAFVCVCMKYMGVQKKTMYLDPQNDKAGSYTYLIATNDFTKVLFNPILLGVVVAAYIITACGLFCKLSKVFPVNYIFLTIFTLCVSWIVGTVCVRTEPKTVLMAAVLTMAMFLGLTIYACTTKTDFTGSFCGMHIVVIHITLIIFMIPLCFILHDRIMHLIFAYIGVAIFSFYIIYDTQLIMNGDRTDGDFDMDDHILAAVILYLDIINLFLKILQVLKGGEE